MRRFLLVFVVLVAVFSLSTIVALAQDPAAGKAAWEEQSNCQKCHGPMGEGLWGGPLAGSTKAADAWVTQVRTPRNRMPAYSAEQVSDETIANIHAYLSSLEKPASFTPASVELPADAMPGQQLLVDKKCVACHGENGPSGGFINRGETPTAEAVITQLRTPRNAMPTFSEAQVSEADAALIAEFLASQMPVETPQTLPDTGDSQADNSWGWGIVLGGVAVMIGLGWRRVSVRVKT